jgi:hypothetical protein
LAVVDLREAKTCGAGDTFIWAGCLWQGGRKRRDPFNKTVVVYGCPWYVEGRKSAYGSRDMELLILPRLY